MLSQQLARRLPQLRTAVRHRGQVRWGSGGHDVGYEPGGYLFGRPPLKAGEKRQRYWWEGLWYYGYYGSFIVFFTFEYFSPKTTLSHASKVEAHKRLAERGETFGWPFPPDYALVEPKAEA
ncbi:hypothetical protein HK102_005716 [Quaeritorhiza haematococci]|nr:hypothetical protein HK102_005716 [Quaeritorhiza haematococci]